MSRGDVCSLHSNGGPLVLMVTPRRETQSPILWTAIPLEVILPDLKELSMGRLTSTPDLVNDEAHQPHPHPDLLVNLGVVGLHGDPDILNEALKHLERNININMTMVSNQTGERFLSTYS